MTDPTDAHPEAADADRRFSPRDFLRARRPERFSDSVVEEGPGLDRPMLEYHLDTITNRNQETEFERFVKRLAEAEICPNLLPQTGPTGGGDSKVDAETYPVSDALSLIWYIGEGRKAAAERWAFAFSAKKDWRAKVKSDIAKLAGTDRGYTKAFFITNQFVRDKDRAEIEDALRTKHGLDVRIFDRSWILDRVFGSGRELLAIEELGLKTEVRRRIRRGPLDLVRERDLNDAEGRIEEATQQSRFTLQLVEDCIEAATLARGLDLPRTEVDGRFDRAQRVAQQYGSKHQRLVAAYEAAWTAYWWYEDYERFSVLYGAVEEHATGSENPYDLELLTNLGTILHTLVKRGVLDTATSDYRERLDTLLQELHRLEEQQDRPSTALYARTLRLEIQLLISLPGDVDHILSDLETVIRDCEGLIGFPLTPLVEILTEMGDVLGQRPAYNTLFDVVVQVASVREGEVAAARMLLRRGAQQLDADRPYDAIRSIGQVLGRLYRHESRDDLVRALYLCSCAYERVGLLWAARGTVLMAASVATNAYWTYDEITPLQFACCSRMKWLELQLGRLPHILAWHEVDTFLRRVLEERGYNADRLAQGEIDFNAILGILLLRTDLWDLKHLSALPDVLDNLGLELPAIALKYALGHEDQLPEELVGDKTDIDALKDFFARWRDQPAASELPVMPALYEQQRVSLSTIVVGCQVVIDSDNASPCVELAEWMLASLESLLSTRLLDGVAAREPMLTVDVRTSEFGEAPFSYEIQEPDGRPHIEIRCTSFDPYSISAEFQGQLKDRLCDMLIHLLGRVYMITTPEEVMTELFRDERALDRSIHFTSSFITLGNVLGHSPKTSISSWVDGDARDYGITRNADWDVKDRHARAEADAVPKRDQPTMGSGEPPPELLDLSRTSHRQVATVSLIREALWDKAGWSGTAFLWSADDSEPPILAPIFTNEEAATQIFSNWRKELGEVDSDERLRVAIIRGIKKENPNAYRVTFGANPSATFPGKDIKYVVMMSRLNTMEPATSQNLDIFLDSYNRHGTFILAHAVSDPELKSIEPILDDHIVKHELHVRQAWEISRNDFDGVGVTEKDDPIIPSDQVNAPVVELLRWKRERQPPMGAG